MTVCQMCKKDLSEMDDDVSKLPEGVGDLSFYPAKYMRICSYKCANEAIRFNAAWNFKALIKNMNLRIPTFTDFQKVFEFDEAGGYAEGKYEDMRRNPLGFMYGLDETNFAKLIKVPR